MATYVAYQELSNPKANRVIRVDTDDYKLAMEEVEFFAGGKSNIIRMVAIVSKEYRVPEEQTGDFVQEKVVE